MNIFAYDSKLVHILNRLTDLMLLNILTIIGMIPLFCLVMIFAGLLAVTPVSVFIAALSVFSGTALTALHYCLLKIVRGEDAYTFRSFFKACKVNFKQGSVIGTLFLLVYGVLLADVRIFRLMQESATEGILTSTNIMNIICFAAMIFVFMDFLYAFPLQARFQNTIRATLKNAFLMAILSFPRTVLMAAVQIAVYVLAYYFSVQIMPFMILFGISAPAYLCTMIYSPVLKRFEPEEEIDADSTDESSRP